MKDTFRQSMAWLHTWAGLVLGWLLFFIFVTGTAGYFDTEIDRWMQPELPAASIPSSAAGAADVALGRLRDQAPTAERWFIGLPGDRSQPYLRIFWQAPKSAEGKRAPIRDEQLDLATGMPLQARDTDGGQFLYRMHWRLHYLPAAVAEWTVGVATMFMLVALVTGIVVHKKIFADFFTFRPAKGQRSWLDAHNVVSVISLPFQLMITYSGLVFMMFTYMPLVIAAWYGAGAEGHKTFLAEVFEPPALTEAAGVAAPLAPLAPMIAEAESRWGQGQIRSLDIRHPNDAHARVIVSSDVAAGPLRSSERLVFDGASGALVAEQPAMHSTAKATRDLFLGLHEGLFAGALVRWLYFLSGLLGAAMIATGLILWAVKRRQREEKARGAAHRGLRLVERLNVATVFGLPVAIAAYFWANRLLPTGMADRAAWEANVLFITWASMLAHAAVRPASRAWLEQAWVAASAFGLLPALNALTTGRHLGQSLPAGDWVFAGFDLAMLTFGIAFALAAHRLAHGPSQSPRILTAPPVIASTPVAGGRQSGGLR